MDTGPRFIVSIRRTGEALDRTCDPWIDHKGSDITTAPQRLLGWIYMRGGTKV